MNVLSITGLDANQVAPIVKGLQQLLADFQVYYANLRGYHWHVRGPQFFTLHSQFEKMYDEAAESVDEIAERILQLGATPENRFSEYLKISQLKEQTNVSAASDIISAILESLRVLIAQERAVLALADEAGDTATSDLLSDLLDGQEKTAWMVAAYLGQAPRSTRVPYIYDQPPRSLSSPYIRGVETAGWLLHER